MSERWQLANRTLELGKARVRVEQLEQQVAFRDARIAELEGEVSSLRSECEAARGRLQSLQARFVAEDRDESGVDASATVPRKAAGATS